MTTWYTNAPASIYVPNAFVMYTSARVTLASADRMTMAGTGRLILTGVSTAVLRIRAYATGTIEILQDLFALQYKRVSLVGNARATLSGSAELMIFDFGHSGRLVLAGVGGGS